jgi:glycosyltransferase involved in cell wall biosynthesis
LIKHDKEGYGNAYLEAFKHSRGKYLFMADADCTYDFNEIPVFIDYLRQGFDLVIGDRFSGKMDENAMSWSHKYFGNPVLSTTLRLFFKTKIHDTLCGMRAIKRDVLDRLQLKTEGMEFGSEMIINALKNNLKIKEVPIDYHKRAGKSKLKSFRDAWRYFRFMLLYSPLFLFFIPGIILFLLGLVTLLWFYFGSPQIFGIQFHYYPMFISSLLILLGYQLITFSAFAKSYAFIHLKEKSPFMEKAYRYITIERALFIGGIFLIFGLGILIYILTKWINSNLSSFNELKNAILAITLIILGFQTIFSSFMLSIIGIQNTK